MDPRNYVPSCAVCGGPSDPECPCEGERLRLCIDAAEKRWIESWITKIRFVQFLSLHCESPQLFKSRDVTANQI